MVKGNFEISSSKISFLIEHFSKHRKILNGNVETVERPIVWELFHYLHLRLEDAQVAYYRFMLNAKCVKVLVTQKMTTQSILIPIIEVSIIPI